MGLEQLSNNAQTTTTGSIDGASDPTTFTVASASAFPSTGNFRVLIGSEILLVTSVSGNIFTASRAKEGTSISSHTSGTTVSHILTAAGFRQVTSEYLLSDTNANRPSAGVIGRTFFPTDKGTVWHDNGSTWQCWVHGMGPFEPPISDFTTWVNQDAAVVATTANLLCLSLTGVAGGSENVNARVKSLISAPWTFTLVFSELKAPGSVSNYGAMLRDSSSGKLQAIGFNPSDNTVNGWKWNSPTSFNSSDYSDQLHNAYFPFIMCRIRNDSTNYNFEHSNDFVNWTTNRQIAVGSIFAPWDQVGFYINVLNTRGIQRSGITVYHAKLEAGA